MFVEFLHIYENVIYAHMNHYFKSIITYFFILYNLILWNLIKLFESYFKVNE
ncbi:hypothetical protein CLOSBL3_20391 [Clostridiaceae bacterium BL-3]|jgi:hypothetical protein|nr:hypothetical protein CLOSBL3_20391 [Clostridiaceae bacterium BL-3]